MLHLIRIDSQETLDRSIAVYQPSRLFHDVTDSYDELQSLVADASAVDAESSNISLRLIGKNNFNIDVDGMLPPLVEASAQQNPLPCAFVASTNPLPLLGANTNGDVNLNGHYYHYCDDGEDTLPPIVEPSTQRDTSTLTHSSPVVAADGSSDPVVAANLDMPYSMRRCDDLDLDGGRRLRIGRSVFIFSHTRQPAIRRIFAPRHSQLLRDVLQNSRGSRTALSTRQGLYEHHSDTWHCKPVNHADMSWRSNDVDMSRCHSTTVSNLASQTKLGLGL